MKSIYLIYYTHFVGASKKDFMYPLISTSKKRALTKFEKMLHEDFDENLDDYIIKDAVYIGDVKFDINKGIKFIKQIEVEL